MTENEISYIIRGAIFDVYYTLGVGLSESVYVRALEYELTERGLSVKREVPIPVHYKSLEMDFG